MKKRRQKLAHTLPIPATVLLTNESERLKLLSYTSPSEKARLMLGVMSWALKISATYLDSVSAPERLVRYVPVKKGKT